MVKVVTKEKVKRKVKKTKKKETRLKKEIKKATNKQPIKDLLPESKDITAFIDAMEEQRKWEPKQPNPAYQHHFQYKKEQQAYAHKLYTQETEQGASKEGQADLGGELSLEEIDGMILNAKFKGMHLSHAKQYSNETEERFKLRNLCNWNVILNRIKYTLG